LRYWSFAPHHCGFWAGSVKAWKTRSGGAAMKISARTVLLSGVIWAVAIQFLISQVSFPRSHFPRLAGFDVSLQPVHGSIPPGLVALRLLEVSGKSRVSHSHQSASAYSM